MNMMEAFSNASENCEVALCVKASNLDRRHVSSNLLVLGRYYVDRVAKQLATELAVWAGNIPRKGYPDVLLVDREAQVE